MLSSLKFVEHFRSRVTQTWVFPLSNHSSRAFLSAKRASESMEGTKDLKLARPGQVQIPALLIIPMCVPVATLSLLSVSSLYSGPVRQLRNEATWR